MVRVRAVRGNASALTARSPQALHKPQSINSEALYP
jgi:hypothetical protein